MYEFKRVRVLSQHLVASRVPCTVACLRLRRPHWPQSIIFLGRITWRSSPSTAARIYAFTDVHERQLPFHGHARVVCRHSHRDHLSEPRSRALPQKDLLDCCLRKPVVLLVPHTSIFFRGRCRLPFLMSTHLPPIGFPKSSPSTVTAAPSPRPPSFSKPQPHRVMLEPHVFLEGLAGEFVVDHLLVRSSCHGF